METGFGAGQVSGGTRVKGRWQQGICCSICSASQVQVQGLQRQSFLQARAELSRALLNWCAVGRAQPSGCGWWRRSVRVTHLTWWGLFPPLSFQLLDLKIFVDTDSDIRLVRRLRRDISERGRDIEGVIKQYNKFVKPAFDQYIQPTMRLADIVVPRGTCPGQPRAATWLSPEWDLRDPVPLPSALLASPTALRLARTEEWLSHAKEKVPPVECLQTLAESRFLGESLHFSLNQSPALPAPAA